MKSTISLAVLAIPALLATPSFAADKAFTVKVDGIGLEQPIPAENAVCLPTPDGKSTNKGKNKRPTISWNHAPKGTESFAIVVTDTDVPADFSMANKEGQMLEESAPRKDFYHWAVVDIPGNVERIPGGSPIGVGESATNDMKDFIKDPKAYGGPCPPWNDARIHHYHFQVYALDVKSLGLTTGINAADVAKKLADNPHVIAKSEVVGTYTLNKDLRP